MPPSHEVEKDPVSLPHWQLSEFFRVYPLKSALIAVSNGSIAAARTVQAHILRVYRAVRIRNKADYAAKANTYLMMVDITDDQFAAAEMQIKALENLIRTELSVSADAQTLKLEEVSDDFYNKVLAIFKNLAAAIDASVVISSDFDRTNTNTTGSVVLRSNSDSSALVYIFGQPSPAAGINVPVIVACSALAVAAIIAVAFFVARKRTVRS